jgi:8-oxo-dGTP diphosphatase
MAQREIEGRQRWVCPACGFVDYEQLKVGAAVIARQGERIVLVHRRQPPFAGRWCLPAGYVEADEDPADAAVRECLEETGLLVEPDRLFGVYYWDDDPRGNGVLIVYQATVVSGELRASDEGTPAWFTASSLPAEIAGAGHAVALRDWANATHEVALEQPFRYCPKCAGRLAMRQAFGRDRLVCQACGFILFRDPKLAAGALVAQNGKVLLARRSMNPEMGKWYVPAGFVEFDETVTQAAVREIHEETGLEVALDGLLGVYDFGSAQGGRGTLVLYRATVVGGSLQAGDDADAVAFFGPDELPDDIAFETSRTALEAWKAVITAY